MDRNYGDDLTFADGAVALRKESVDRNGVGSWRLVMNPVALRKESVDRNHAVQIVIVKMHGRSPQGERG